VLKAKKVIPIWQPVGYSTHLIMQRLAEKIGKKTSHTGTLDPMAEGVVIALAGKERLRKKEFAKWQKAYQFEITFGISTDTYDGLGLVEETDFLEIRANGLQKIAQEMEGEYVQKVPKFSTKKIAGRHLHEYARAREKVEVPLKKGKIFSLQYLDLKKVKTKSHLEKQIEKINKVRGDFRQKEIMNRWKTFLAGKDCPKTLQIASFKVKTSKGIYIRSLSLDIAKKLGTVGFASQIIRFSNGKYSNKDCYELSDIFEPKELTGDYFYSKFVPNLQ
jgi:tRNA pseudouridine55 synthase